MEIPQPMWSLVLILNHFYGEDFSCSYLTWISLLQMTTGDWHPVSIQPHHCAPTLPSSPCSPDCSLVPGHIPNVPSISLQVNIEVILVWYLRYLCRKPSSGWLESLWRCRAFPSPRQITVDGAKQQRRILFSCAGSKYVNTNKHKWYWWKSLQWFFWKFPFILSSVAAEEWSRLSYVEIKP